MWQKRCSQVVGIMLPQILVKCYSQLYTNPSYPLLQNVVPLGSLPFLGLSSLAVSFTVLSNTGQLLRIGSFYNTQLTHVCAREQLVQECVMYAIHTQLAAAYLCTHITLKVIIGHPVSKALHPSKDYIQYIHIMLQNVCVRSEQKTYVLQFTITLTANCKVWSSGSHKCMMHTPHTAKELQQLSHTTLEHQQ